MNLTLSSRILSHTHTHSNDTKVEILNKLLYKTHPLTNTFIHINTHTHMEGHLPFTPALFKGSGNKKETEKTKTRLKSDAIPDNDY